MLRLFMHQRPSPLELHGQFNLTQDKREGRKMSDTHTQAAEFLERQLESEMPNIDAAMRRSLANIGAHLAERKTEEARSPQTAKILQFPLPFGEDTRAVSNPMAKCSLFAAVKERQNFKDYVLVGIVNGMKVEYIGEQLNQDDHDTLLQLVKMALHKPFGEDVFQSVNAVLDGLGRTTHQEQRRQLFEQISRLVRGTLRITPPKMVRYEGHLLDDATTPEDQKTEPRLRRHLSYRLNPKFAVIYSSSAYTLFDWRERVKIKGRGSEVAKWVHLWLIGNAEQFAHKVETIRQLCVTACNQNTPDLQSTHFPARIKCN